MMPKKPKRHVTACRRMEMPAGTAVNERWSMDFMSDQLYDGRRIRLLTIADNFNHDSLEIEVAEHIGREHVVEVLTRIGKSSMNCRKGYS
jgi:putative transposase